MREMRIKFHKYLRKKILSVIEKIKNPMKVSDYIAKYLASKGGKYIFAISGAGNVHLLDSIAQHPNLIYICPHHEQAGVMAAIAYQRISRKKIGIMLTTSGPGAANAITGVLDAWADSIPCLIISGQEKTAYVKKGSALRMWGVQGFNIVRAVGGICKYAAMVNDPNTIRYHLDKAYYFASQGRPGPVWLDIPIDTQAAIVDPKNLIGYKPENISNPDLKDQITKILSLMSKAERPVFLLGHGIRLAGAEALIPLLMRKFPVPFLTAWNGADMIPTSHSQHFGREGVYGQRCANFIVQNCDLLVTIGTRLAIPQVGHDFSEFARAAKKIVVDVDPTELAKFGRHFDLLTIQADARYFIENLLRQAESQTFLIPRKWIDRCRDWKDKYPLVDESIHKKRRGYVNSYSFINRLSINFSSKEVVVTDMGTALTCTHQAIILDKKQRLITSTGLGEMGYGLPAAIGACFANDKKRVILITGDGSIMMNLQELQTVIHHRLPIKIFIYTNDGYLSIKHTQIGLFGNRLAGSGKDTGVSCPDFSKVGKAFGFSVFKISEEKKMDSVIKRVLETRGPVICEVVMYPLQPLVPKLSFSLKPDGSLVSPPIEDLYPFLSRDQLKKEMIIGLHTKSLMVSDVDSKNTRDKNNLKKKEIRRNAYYKERMVK